MFDGLYRPLTILGESVAPIMHQALEVVHGTEVVKLTMWILVKIMSLTCVSENRN